MKSLLLGIFEIKNRKLLVVYVLKTGLFHVWDWASYHSETFYLIFLNQIADDVSFTASNN